MSDAINLIGRVLLSVLFLHAGYGKAIDPSGILNYAGTKHFMDLVAGGAPAPIWLGYLIAAIELLGGLALLLGFQTRLAAWGLFLWVIVATYFGHPWWDMEGAARSANEIQFLKNLAIMGGLLMLSSAGPGRVSLDGRGATA
ncbi:MAG: DoxX family protein [Bradyrhizobiaceae bacterium]|nr:DoxX family protein [Bradyrhizobiaceae bacterium]